MQFVDGVFIKVSDSKKQADEKMTRNQHYVPQCLLKHFGWKANKGIWKINVFDVARSKVGDRPGYRDWETDRKSVV